MIQVCSQCGTRWNVRDQRREWCPRCRGPLLGPESGPVPGSPDPRWGTGGGPSPSRGPGAPGWQRMRPQLPPGFRWIAVRPGAAPPPRYRRRSRGPTPRYSVMPRWGLADRIDQAFAPAPTPAKTGPTAALVRTTLFVSVLMLGLAALVYVVRYVLLVINRNTLLNSVVALAAQWLGILASVTAFATVIACAVTAIRWLIARRAAVFAHHGLPEPRSVRSLWAGCVMPLGNVVWAPVYVIELAVVEGHYARLRRPILQWWIAWVFSYAVWISAIATSFATDAQGIANNTVMMVLTYLLAAVTVAALSRVFEGFERKPVQRPAHRWVAVGADQPDLPPARESAGPVELQGREPAA
ncbi:DUF4328 domain-containing protein [Mycobacterium sp. THU-M104]|uniref:DUF4328 domain-containing protein n=1 Tax=Mycobacterium sp. THU-M104 TaxID=3410515 RepID=UPI003B9B27E0